MLMSKRDMIYTGSKAKKIVIHEEVNADMMQIMYGDKCVFFGNECDFKRDPKSLKEFLASIGVDVKVVKGPFEN